MFIKIKKGGITLADTLYRVDDLDRYDDRLLDFISKYTINRFAIDENAGRVSPISVLAREIVLNI